MGGPLAELAKRFLCIKVDEMGKGGLQNRRSELGFGEFVNCVKDFLSSEKGGFDSENRMWYNLRKIPQNTEIAENH